MIVDLLSALFRSITLSPLPLVKKFFRLVFLLGQENELTKREEGRLKQALVIQKIRKEMREVKEDKRLNRFERTKRLIQLERKLREEAHKINSI